MLTLMYVLDPDGPNTCAALTYGYVAEAVALRRKSASTDSDWISIGLAAPARRALVNANILKVFDLATRTESSVSQLHGMGPSAMKLLKAKMKSKKIAFKL